MNYVRDTIHYSLNPINDVADIMNCVSDIISASIFRPETVRKPLLFSPNAVHSRKNLFDDVRDVIDYVADIMENGCSVVNFIPKGLYVRGLRMQWW